MFVYYCFFSIKSFRMFNYFLGLSLRTVFMYENERVGTEGRDRLIKDISLGRIKGLAKNVR